MLDTIHETDIFDLMGQIPPASVDLTFLDPPYGTTRHEWDTPFPLPELWAGLTRITKPDGAILICGNEPFASGVRLSNPGMYRYDLIIYKKPTRFLDAGHRPLQAHEVIMVFYRQQPVYNPQFWYSTPYKTTTSSKTGAYKVDSMKDAVTSESTDGKRYPLTVLKFPVEQAERTHPTQKSRALLEYLIMTYTNRGATVFDGAAGSGTTAHAAMNTGRRYIVGDAGTDKKTGRKWADLMRERLNRPTQRSMLDSLKF